LPAAERFELPREDCRHVLCEQEAAPEGIVLNYVVQEKPLLTEIRFSGNTKFDERELRKKLVVCVVNTANSPHTDTLTH